MGRVMSAYLDRNHLRVQFDGLTCSMTFTRKMVLAVFGDLIILWMTKSLMDNIHGWGVLFDDRVGDGTVTVADVVFKEFA
ncbi:Mitochondrial fission protein ELM1 [Zea mays]|uniref:Mitochondrial fission protein ELM1 n=1 Tax=Zea mays TaxID=4577 RepID=A0A1D6IHV3_MAIZE|nr:Mitochondrial fission protein ELM1 [Zea mays]